MKRFSQFEDVIFQSYLAVHPRSINPPRREERDPPKKIPLDTGNEVHHLLFNRKQETGSVPYLSR